MSLNRYRDDVEHNFGWDTLRLGCMNVWRLRVAQLQQPILDYYSHLTTVSRVST